MAETTSGSSSFNAAKVALLARLELTPEQLTKFQAEMEQIVGYVEQLSEVNVEGIVPTAHGVPRVNVLRDDCESCSFTREQMLSNAPATVDGELVRMPQVLPGEGIQ